MAARIRDSQSYLARLSDDQQKLAYEIARGVREFEIELYWKRATYFWTLIAATFAGFFALKSATAQHPALPFVVSCIGLVLSTSWYLVNRGSKYWQENWERHVDALEDKFAGPLYKTTISKEQFRWWNPSDGYPFSVTKVNQLCSLFVAVLWVGLAVASFPSFHLPAYLVTVAPYVLAGLTALFLFLVVFCAIGGSQGKDRVVDFREVPLVSSKDRLSLGARALAALKHAFAPLWAALRRSDRLH